MVQRFGKHGDKTIEELIVDDPAYVMWLYEQDPEAGIVSIEQYGAAIDEICERDDEFSLVLDLGDIDVELDDE